MPRPPLATAVFLRPVSSSEANNNNTTEEDSTPRQAEDTPVPRERQPLVRTNPLPPKDLPQEALNRVFTDELLKAKMRLKSSQTPTPLPGRSQETGGGSEGVPPPPPPPVLPPGLRPAAGGKGRAAVAQPPPLVNPREELLLAIRRVGGAGGLRKTRN